MKKGTKAKTKAKATPFVKVNLLSALTIDMRKEVILKLGKGVTEVENISLDMVEDAGEDSWSNDEWGVYDGNESELSQVQIESIDENVECEKSHGTLNKDKKGKLYIDWS